MSERSVSIAVGDLDAAAKRMQIGTAVKLLILTRTGKSRGCDPVQLRRAVTFSHKKAQKTVGHKRHKSKKKEIILCLLWLLQTDDGGAEAAGLGWSVGPVEYECGAREDRAYHLTLHANALAVNYPHRLESFLVRDSQVLFDNWFYVTRRNRVQVKDVSDLDLHRLREWIIGIAVVHKQI